MTPDEADEERWNALLAQALEAAGGDEDLAYQLFFMRLNADPTLRAFHEAFQRIAAENVREGAPGEGSDRD